MARPVDASADPAARHRCRHAARAMEMGEPASRIRRHRRQRRWARRLDGLAEQYRLQIRELQADEPDSPRIPRLERELQNLEHLRAFALPLIESISDWPDASDLGRLAPAARRLRAARAAEAGRRAPRAGRSPTDGDCRPGPADRSSRRARRSPPVARGRSARESLRPRLRRQPASGARPPFKVVFVPGLAERCFRRSCAKTRCCSTTCGSELDSRPRRCQGRSRGARTAAAAPGGRCRDAIGSTSPSRASKPPKPARACRRSTRSKSCARSPDACPTIRRSSAWRRRSRARVSHGPRRQMPPMPSTTSSTTCRCFARLMLSSDDVKGHAHYMLTLNDCLQALGHRAVGACGEAMVAIRRPRPRHRCNASVSCRRNGLNARPYSVSALQKYAACPYQFFLSAAYRLAPLEEPEPLQRMDPLTKGSLFHQVQAEFFRALQKSEAHDCRPST